jgi:hypothetical protein
MSMTSDKLTEHIVKHMGRKQIIERESGEREREEKNVIKSWRERRRT